MGKLAILEILYELLNKQDRGIVLDRGEDEDDDCDCTPCLWISSISSFSGMIQVYFVCDLLMVVKIDSQQIMKQAFVPAHPAFPDDILAYLDGVLNLAAANQ